jgi:hypothetical protein
MARLPGFSWAPPSSIGKRGTWEASDAAHSGGQARRQLVAFGRGGAFVVVRAPRGGVHGEGRQRAGQGVAGRAGGSW